MTRHAIRASAWRLQWLVAWLFMIGGSCFAIASTPYASSTVDVRLIGITYVIGAIFFTSAAFCQLQLVGNETRLAVSPDARTRTRIRLWSPRITAVLWWACAVQFVGTLYFNANTIHAMNTTLTTQEELLVVWRPEALGSICFLVASLLALVARDAAGRITGIAWNTTDFWIGWWKCWARSCSASPPSPASSSPTPATRATLRS